MTKEDKTIELAKKIGMMEEHAKLWLQKDAKKAQSAIKKAAEFLKVK